MSEATVMSLLQAQVAEIQEISESVALWQGTSYDAG